jgi:hypothetical protein
VIGVRTKIDKCLANFIVIKNEQVGSEIRTKEGKHQSF